VGAGLTLPRRGQGRLERLERLSLSPQHSLNLVRVGDRELLIAVHAGGCTLLEAAPKAQGISSR
jgi:flagellar biogenesis protein FliO